jgi:hypothetical protein
MSTTKQADLEEKTVSGTVKELNFAPKGEIDGLILDVEGESVQVNVPPDQAASIAGLVGQEVALKVGPEPKVADHPKGAHPVHKLIAFQGHHAHVAGGEPGPKKPKPKDDHGHGHGEPAEVRGTVKRLNYAKHGEANGVVLDDGDFLHLKPDGMKKAGLKVGQQVSAKGHAKPSRSGGRAIEVEVVNGLAVGPKQPH